MNWKSFSNLGNTYSNSYMNENPRAKAILSGAYNFHVEEIKVFQMQQKFQGIGYLIL